MSEPHRVSTDEAPRQADAQSLWWSSPALARTWTLVAERLEREGLVPQGLVTVAGLNREEKRALSDLLGRSILGDRVRIDLAAVDQRLRDRAGRGLVSAAATVLGRALTDRPAARAASAARREEPHTVYAAWREAHPDAAALGLDDRLDDWLATLRRDGVLGRDADPAALVKDALTVLWHQRVHVRRSGHCLSGHGPYVPVPVARTELAARLLGDAHALDDDRRLASVVLRATRLLAPAVASQDDQEPTISSVREEWESLGVLTDRVSSTCLTLGLRTVGDDACARRIRGYANSRSVLHLTWRDLDEGLHFAPGQTVLVCENPRVVEAAAEAADAGVGLVTTSGRPALVTLEVLTRLRDAGTQLHYHGDFDWPGVAMANDVWLRFGARPWRMSASDYLALPARLPLRGPRIEASWDPELAAAMDQRGLVVHEEAALPDLTQSLTDLIAEDRGSPPT